MTWAKERFFVLTMSLMNLMGKKQQLVVLKRRFLVYSSAVLQQVHCSEPKLQKGSDYLTGWPMTQVSIIEIGAQASGPASVHFSPTVAGCRGPQFIYLILGARPSGYPSANYLTAGTDGFMIILNISFSKLCFLICVVIKICVCVRTHIQRLHTKYFVKIRFHVLNNSILQQPLACDPGLFGNSAGSPKGIL